MKVVRVILLDWSEISAANRPQIAEYRREVHLHFVPVLTLFHGCHFPSLSTELVYPGEEGFSPHAAGSGLAVPLPVSDQLFHCG